MRTTTQAARVDEFLKGMRLPELRDLPDPIYAAIVSEASRIARHERWLWLVKQSIERAQALIERETWPIEKLECRHRDGTVERWDHFPTHDPVTLCWMLDLTADPEGFVRLDALYQISRRHSPGWNRIYEYGVVGALRSNSSGGLVVRAAPRTWRLTDRGRELLDLVFAP